MLHRLFFSFRCRSCSEMQGCAAMAKTLSKRRPSAATYLCREATKARFDNRPPRGGGFQRGGPQPSPFGRFKVGGFSRGKGNRNPFPLEWRSLVTFFRQGKKVTRRRQKYDKTRRRQKSKKAKRKHPVGDDLSPFRPTLPKKICQTCRNVKNFPVRACNPENAMLYS